MWPRSNRTTAGPHKRKWASAAAAPARWTLRARECGKIDRRIGRKLSHALPSAEFQYGETRRRDDPLVDRSGSGTAPLLRGTPGIEETVGSAAAQALPHPGGGSREE